MNERLNSLLKRYAELNQLIQDPALVKDQKRYRDVMKEHSYLDEIAQTHGNIEKLEKTVSDTRLLVQEEKDQEMLKLAREEIQELENNLEKYRENLKLLLIPKDPRMKKI